MDKNIKDLLRIDIEWIKRGQDPEWYAFVEGNQCELRMNDFPEEPLYTLIWQGDCLDLDEAPSTWSIPRGAGGS